MSPKAIFGLLKDTFKAWSEDKASRLGAALAYYTIFSIGPLLLVIIAVAGLVFGEAAARGQIVGAIQDVVGPAGAQVLQDALKNAGKPGAGIISGIIGVVTLLLGAAGIFGQLQDALNTIWGVEAKKAGIMGMLRERLLTFLMVLGTGLLLLASLVANAVLSALGNLLGDVLPGGPLVWQILNYVVSLALITLVFALIYKVLPDAKIAWGDVWIGAAVTTVLFLLGQIALGLYLGNSNVGSPYGAAGSLVVVLVWIYYTAQIVFFGAEFTQVYANSHGSRVVPDENAEWVTEDARARQGMSRQKSSRQRREQAMEARRSPWFS